MIYQHNQTNHQKQQLKFIGTIEEQLRAGKAKFTTVSPVKNFESDPRICLTSVHFPKKELLKPISSLQQQIKHISPSSYIFKPTSIHLTIKNVRVINNPPRFTNHDIQTAIKVFSDVIPKHKQFEIYYFRLLAFSSNIALIGTTEPELDRIILDLDKKLQISNLPDDKQYVNKKYFFSNITLARFNKPLTKSQIKKIKELSNQINFKPYKVDSISLIQANASLFKLKLLSHWQLLK
jgi:2'-5' RNA ligase